MARGCRYAEIAKQLGITKNTVASYMKSAYRKLKVRSGPAAVMHAVKLQLLGRHKPTLPLVKPKEGGMRLFSAIVFASLLLGGCAATGPTLTEHLAASNPVPASSARLIFFRTRDSILNSALSASIKIDSGPVGACDYAGFKVVDVERGKHLVTVSVNRWDQPGTCDLDVEVTAGNEYYLEIKPRPEYVAGGLAGALLGFGLTRGLGSGPFGLPTTGDIVGAGLVQGGAGVVGAAVESSDKQCGGAFSVESLARDLALPRVTNLRMTK